MTVLRTVAMSWRCAAMGNKKFSNTDFVTASLIAKMNLMRSDAHVSIKKQLSTRNFLLMLSDIVCIVSIKGRYLAKHFHHVEIPCNSTFLEQIIKRGFGAGQLKIL